MTDVTDATPVQTCTIDGKDYSLDDLSDVAKAQIMNLRVVDQEMAALQQKLAIMQTARNAYSAALAEEIKEVN